ncbi:MAG: restriction endonuclease Mrr [Halobacteriales archaeon]|jgi:restriction endonuclease Mrr
MPLLDDLSGFEFEDLMEDVFRNLGYENVRQSNRTGDEGRDVLMEEVVDGRRRVVIVECKHQRSVGRPVVQKLHSAVTTYDHDGPKRGMVVATGTFTEPAEEYAEKVGTGGSEPRIELLDGTDLREIGEQIGLDLYNGRIEVLCDETLRPTDPTGRFDEPVREAFRTIENIEVAELPAPRSRVTFQPVLTIEARTDAVFETSVGVIHEIHEKDQLTLFADRGRPERLEDSIRRLVHENWHSSTGLDEDHFGELFDDVTVKHFGQTETEYKEWAVEQLRNAHTTTVHYTGDNNVDYEKTCEPNRSDVSVQRITPIYLPEVRQTTHLQGYSYPLEYYAAGPSRVTTEDGIRRCVHCGEDGAGTFTYCRNCGSVNCSDHIKTERWEGTPVCTGCAVTERFALKRKYFYDENNLNAFREEYAAMPIHEKAMENKPLVAGSVIATVLAAVVLLSSAGLI